MKRFKVVCIGYKEPSKEKIKDFLKFEESYLGNKRKVCIHPGICITEHAYFPTAWENVDGEWKRLEGF